MKELQGPRAQDSGDLVHKKLRIILRVYDLGVDWNGSKS
jgi:hypothetical protein